VLLSVSYTINKVKIMHQLICLLRFIFFYLPINMETKNVPKFHVHRNM